MQDHALRQILNDEIHGRPGLPVQSPARITHLAFTLEPGDMDPLVVVTELCRKLGITEPQPGAAHHGVRLGKGLFKYERHGEFYRLSVTSSGSRQTREALAQLPDEVLARLPGKRLVAIHTHILGSREKRPDDGMIFQFFGHEDVACSRVHQGKSMVWSDFRIGADGFTRMLIHDGGVSPHRLGRLTRRLHEIETYRMMALLAYPLARSLQGALAALETSLSAAVEQLAATEDNNGDAALLQQLTRIARDVERLSNTTIYRFSAAQAYATLVRKRIEELGEDRVLNFQRLGVFLERRFSPAMATCSAVSNRIASLAQRCERASNLLRTRVDIALEGQNQKLLQSMEKRARQQLMLQETVEGLSVAAISYYVIGIMGKLIEGLAKFAPFDEKLAQFISIPLVILAVWLMAQQIKKKVHRASSDA